jgi:hypothetical protein
MLISKGDIGGLEGPGIGDFFFIFSSRGKSILIAKGGLNGLKRLGINLLS